MGKIWSVFSRILHACERLRNHRTNAKFAMQYLDHWFSKSYSDFGNYVKIFVWAGRRAVWEPQRQGSTSKEVGWKACSKARTSAKTERGEKKTRCFENWVVS